MSQRVCAVARLVSSSSMCAAVAVAGLAVVAQAQCGSEWLPSAGTPGVNGIVRAMTMWDPDGTGPLAPRLVVAGTFTLAGGTTANRIASYDAVTGQWATMGTGLNNAVYALAALPNGELVAGGQFTTAGGAPIPYIARWNGSSWSALGAGLGSFGVYALLPLSNGDLVAGGTFTTAGGAPANYIARWNGTTWSAFGSGMNNYVYALTELPNGDIVAGGNFTTPTSHIARWNGATWSSLSSGINFQVYALAAMPGNDVVAAGTFTIAGGVNVSRIARWNNAASTWSSMGGGMDGDLFCLQVMPNGDLVVGGFFNTAGGVPANSIARWNGSVWAPLGLGTNAGVRAIALLPDGELDCGGDFLTAGAVTCNRFARYITPAPSIATQPADTLTCPAGPGTLTVAGGGNGPFFYAWQWSHPVAQPAWTPVSNGLNTDSSGQPFFDATGAQAAGCTIDPPGSAPGFHAIMLNSPISLRCIVSTACGSTTSNPARLSVCLANFNCDGAVDFFDYLDFVDAFTSGASSADFNADSIIDFFDYLDFVDAFTRGC